MPGRVKAKWPVFAGATGGEEAADLRAVLTDERLDSRLLVRYTHADTVKLWVVSITGPALCAYCWLGVLTASECGPTVPGPHDAPVRRALQRSVIGPGAVGRIVPEPSSNVQWPVRAGRPPRSRATGVASDGSAGQRGGGLPRRWWSRRSGTRPGRCRGEDTIIFSASSLRPSVGAMSTANKSGGFPGTHGGWGAKTCNVMRSSVWRHRRAARACPSSPYGDAQKSCRIRCIT